MKKYFILDHLTKKLNIEHNLIIGFVVTFHLLACSFDKVHKMFTLFCLHFSIAPF